MSVRLLLFAFLFSATYCATAFAQFQVPESQLTYIENELKEALGSLEKKVAEIGYQDPGGKSSWQVSQAAWEKLDSKVGYLTPAIEKIVAKDRAKRDDQEKTSLRNFYLSFVNKKTKPKLQALAERVELLQLYKNGGKNGITDPIHLAIAERFWKRRLVDTYRAKSKDKWKIKKLVIKFLNRAAGNFADRGTLDNTTDSLGRDCLKAGCKDPVFRAVSLHLRSWEFRKENAKAQKGLTELVGQLESSDYPPLLRVLARTAQCKVFRHKNIVNGKELDVATADELENAYNDSILELLVAESKCPENIESLQPLFYWMIASDFRGNRHREALYKLISKSDLHDGVKQAALQQISNNLSRSRTLDYETRKDYLKLTIEHGEKATEQLPLSDSVVEMLGMNTRTREEPEICIKWFELGKQRAPGRYTLYRSYFATIALLKDDEEQADFILELLNSDNFDAGIPWIGVRLIREGVGLNSYATDEKNIRDNRKVLLAIETLLKQAPEQGKSSEWCKDQRQHLCHMMLQAEYFDDALGVAKGLDGDFGNYRYKQQRLTFARITELTNPFARETQESIDAGTFDITKVEETILKLANARMEMGPDSSIYIDELVDLLRSIKAFESGEWADLTPETVHLSNFRGDSTYAWKPIENGISINSKQRGAQSKLGWRWNVDSAYMLEADIEIILAKDASKKFGGAAGFGLSDGRYINSTAAKILLNPPKSVATLNTYRRKDFSVKSLLNEKGGNRVRMRVWKGYFEFTINGKLAGQYAIPSIVPGQVILLNRNGAGRTTFKNVRVRKLTDASPTGERIDSVSYWERRATHEPDSKDVQLALENVQAKQKEDIEQHKPDAEPEPKRPPIKVDEGLVAMWTFDQDLSESVSKRNGHSALPTKLVDGKLGNSLLLSEKNTSNQIVADGRGPADLEGPFTFSFWVRREIENGVLISQAGELASLTVKLSDRDLEVYHWRPGLKLFCGVRGKLPLKKWRHITITYDGLSNANGIKIFINGEKRNDSFSRGFHPKEADPIPPIDSSLTRMFFGCQPFEDVTKFGCHAMIDEVRVYNRVLSADEIKQVKSYGQE